MESSTYSIISEASYRCGECPMWDVQNQTFYWSDMLAGELFSYRPASKEIQKIAQGKNVSGFTLNKNGGFVCATHQGLYLWDAVHGWRLLADSCQGQVLHCNDAAADPMGRFLFGTTFYGQTVGDDFERGRLYSVDSDGSLTILDEGFGLSNGIAFSPDQKTLYVTDTYTREIYAYDYQAATGRISNKRVVVKIPDYEGIPDGMTVDAEGFLWSALWYGYGIVRCDPDGCIERKIHIPSGQTSSVMFGGEELTDIYVTSSAEVVRHSIAPQGYDFNAPHNGRVYCIHTDIKGLPEYAADIKGGIQV
ncbi:SMP-30/gluconolactonase/LRE family protein [Ruminococcus gauvreauii]|uniref:SMP-30/gluconolactonase/LRE family protein n=1 Tax=Ruminococcus gauvreauii TaxID=438033 RepID=A0ABY5VEK7_9FIRM|nr:SMP-30/gluconolactonase/LRE family protein [Ruminococcus gauvreauii]UWP58310.1 SMP-30/gluconolactonase/LRE family protein [Ruminococcus gauvreauii]